jgi:hypothetical protein
LSLDPKAVDYPNWSDYNYVLSNPVIFIDPDGREVTIHGKDAKATRSAIQKVTVLNISINDKGVLTAENPNNVRLNKLDKALFSAINDKGVNVNLFATGANGFESKDGDNRVIMVGGFDGSEVIDGKVETTQFFNLKQAEQVERSGLSEVGRDAAHEILESFSAGKNDPGGNANSGFKEAHKVAHKADRKATKLKSFQDKNGETGVISAGLRKGKKQVVITKSTDRAKTITKSNQEQIKQTSKNGL